MPLLTTVGVIHGGQATRESQGSSAPLCSAAGGEPWGEVPGHQRALLVATRPLEQSCVCSQCQEHLSCLCFSHYCFLVRNESGTGSLSALWERDLFPLEKTLPCHHSSLEVLSSACDTHLRRLTFTSTRRQVQQQPVPASAMLRLQIRPGHTVP